MMNDKDSLEAELNCTVQECFRAFWGDLDDKTRSVMSGVPLDTLASMYAVAFADGLLRADALRAKFPHLK